MMSQNMPRGFHPWVAATFGAELGAAVLAFALTWSASGYGPELAATVLTLTIAPSVAFGLLGGAVADRFGPRRVMIAGTLALIVISSILMFAVFMWGAHPATLLVVAVLIGTVSAFYRPAAGVFPRLFVPDALLGTAMARVGMAGQFARTIGPPLGGLLIGLITLGGVAALDAVGGLIMLLTLTLIHPPLERAGGGDNVTLRSIARGLSTAGKTSGVPALLACVGIVAGAVIPAVLLGIPLAARERGWTAAQAGVIEAGWIAGGLAAGAIFAWKGTASRVWRPMALGPVVVALGLAVLALTPNWIWGAVGTTIIGIGVVIFTAHVFPTYVSLAPREMTSRFQSLLIFVQQVPQLFINPAIGLIVAAFGAGPMILGSALVSLAATLTVMGSGTLRKFTTSQEGNDERVPSQEVT